MRPDQRAQQRPARRIHAVGALHGRVHGQEVERRRRRRRQQERRLPGLRRPQRLAQVGPDLLARVDVEHQPVGEGVAGGRAAARGDHRIGVQRPLELLEGLPRPALAEPAEGGVARAPVQEPADRRVQGGELRTVVGVGHVRVQARVVGPVQDHRAHPPRELRGVDGADVAAERTAVEGQRLLAQGPAQQVDVLGVRAGTDERQQVTRALPAGGREVGALAHRTVQGPRAGHAARGVDGGRVLLVVPALHLTAAGHTAHVVPDDVEGVTEGGGQGGVAVTGEVHTGVARSAGVQQQDSGAAGGVGGEPPGDGEGDRGPGGTAVVQRYEGGRALEAVLRAAAGAPGQHGHGRAVRRRRRGRAGRGPQQRGDRDQDQGHRPHHAPARGIGGTNLHAANLRDGRRERPPT